MRAADGEGNVRCVRAAEGEGDCVRGQNPHLLLERVSRDSNSITTGISPDRTSSESCSAGEDRVTGYEQVCEVRGEDL